MAQGHDNGRWVKRALLAAALSAAVTTVVATAATSATAAPAPLPIHPGVQTYTNGAQCTANFVFSDGAATYIGQAAHCAGTGDSTETDGCTSKSLPLGTPVMVGGASRPGVLAYSSWLTMQAPGVAEKNADACAHNDLALVRIDPADAAKVSPTVPFFGGPKGVTAAGAPTGTQVRSYGNSKLRGGVEALSPKLGVSTGDTGNGWSHTVVTASPGIPGDSGSGFLAPDGSALGVLSTLNLAPAPGTNGVSDLNRMLAYAAAHGMPVALVNG